MEGQIKQLCEMGVSQEQAEKALQLANNDFEVAIGYIFDGFPEEKENEYVAISPVGIYESEAERSVEADEEDEDDGYDEFIDEENIFDEVPILRAIDHPAVLPRSAGFMENYVLPIVVVLNEFDAWRESVLSPHERIERSELSGLSQLSKVKELPAENPDNDRSKPTVTELTEVTDQYDFLSIPYNPNWATKKSKTVSALRSDSQFIYELQKIVGFLSPASKRQFVSAAALLESLPTDFKKDLSVIEDHEDLIGKFYQTLSNHLDIAYLFTSTVQDLSEESESNLQVIPIDLELRGDDLYKSLNDLFWSDNNLGNVALSKIAPLLTIHIHGDEEEYLRQPFKLDEVLFPEIYHSKYSSVVTDMTTKKAGINKRRLSITSKLMQFNSFEGKKIKQILLQVQKVFGEDEEAFTDLGDLNESVKAQTADYMSQLDSLNKEYRKLDIFEQDNVIENVAIAKGSPLTPYNLIGIILSDTEYLYRSKRYTNEWVYFSAGYDNQRKVISYNIESVDYETVKTHVMERTSNDFTNGLVLFYGSVDEFERKVDLGIPEYLGSFFAQDNEYLASLIKEAETRGEDVMHLEQVTEHAEHGKKSEDEHTVGEHIGEEIIADDDLIDM